MSAEATSIGEVEAEIETETDGDDDDDCYNDDDDDDHNGDDGEDGMMNLMELLEREAKIRGDNNSNNSNTMQSSSTSRLLSPLSLLIDNNSLQSELESESESFLVEIDDKVGDDDKIDDEEQYKNEMEMKEEEELSMIVPSINDIMSVLDQEEEIGVGMAYKNIQGFYNRNKNIQGLYNSSIQSLYNTNTNTELELEPLSSNNTIANTSYAKNTWSPSSVTNVMELWDQDQDKNNNKNNNNSNMGSSQVMQGLGIAVTRPNINRRGDSSSEIYVDDNDDDDDKSDDDIDDDDDDYDDAYFDDSDIEEEEDDDAGYLMNDNDDGDFENDNAIDDKSDDVDEDEKEDDDYFVSDAEALMACWGYLRRRKLYGTWTDLEERQQSKQLMSTKNIFLPNDHDNFRDELVAENVAVSDYDDASNNNYFDNDDDDNDDDDDDDDDNNLVTYHEDYDEDDDDEYYNNIAYYSDIAYYNANDSNNDIVTCTSTVQDIIRACDDAYSTRKNKKGGDDDDDSSSGSGNNSSSSTENTSNLKDVDDADIVAISDLLKTIKVNNNNNTASLNKNDDAANTDTSSKTVGIVDGTSSSRNVDDDLWWYKEFTSYPTEPSETRKRRVRAMRKLWKDPAYRQRWYEKRWGTQSSHYQQKQKALQKRRNNASPRQQRTMMMTMTDRERLAISRAQNLPSDFLGSDALTLMKEEEIAEAVITRLVSSKKRVEARQETFRKRKQLLKEQMRIAQTLPKNNDDAGTTQLEEESLFFPTEDKMQKSKRNRSEYAKQLYATRLKNLQKQEQHMRKNSNRKQQGLSLLASSSINGISSQRDIKTNNRTSINQKDSHVTDNSSLLLLESQKNLSTPEDALFKIETILDRHDTGEGNGRNNDDDDDDSDNVISIEDVKSVLVPSRLKHRKLILRRILREKFRLKGKCVPPIEVIYNNNNNTNNDVRRERGTNCIIDDNDDDNDHYELEFDRQCTIERLGAYIISLLEKEMRE